MTRFTKITAAFALVSAAALSVSAPAFAASDSPEQSVRATTKTVNGEKLYCISYEITGSRVPVSSCHSKQAWAERGAIVAVNSKTVDTTSQLALADSQR
jgi:hypothetical protein